MNIGTATFGIGAGQWADDSATPGVPEPGGNPVVGYFVEYDAVASVPESASLQMILAGVLALCLAMPFLRK
jgi:hypothetical protein